jgi:LCP family protein required for cell wall assembly
MARGYTPPAPGAAFGALRTLLIACLLFAALLAGLTAGRLLTIALPAVLPGARFEVPLARYALERLPGRLAFEQPGLDHPFNRPVTVLLMGVDRRPGDSDLAVRTDSIAVVRLDPATRRASVLSFPRDLWVAIDAPGGAYWERINASYPEGADSGGSVEEGARQLMHDLARNFGVEADHYVWLDIGGAGRLIDALGGVDVDVPEELSVPGWWYTTDDVSAPRLVSFPPGKQHLSGFEAVAFSRYREDSDLLRAQRQQLVLKAIMKDPFGLGLLLNPFAAWRAATATVKSDLSTARLAGLAYLAGRASADTAFYSLGEDVDGAPTVYPMVTDGGAQVLDWDPENVEHWVALARATR